jgi:alkylmercury lyase
VYAARYALVGRMALQTGFLNKWSHALEPSEDLVWRTVLGLYGQSGRQPRVGEIAAGSDISEERVRALLRKLQSRTLIGIESGTDAIRYAYPFTEDPTGHRVVFKGRSLNSLCAIDTLGAGRMYRGGVMIESRCRLCGGTVRVTTGDEAAPCTVCRRLTLSFGTILLIVRRQKIWLRLRRRLAE